MEYFFTPQEQLPPDVGFALYGGAHICALCLCVALGVILCGSYMRLPARARERMRLGTGCVVLLCEALKVANLAAHGVFGIYYLPLHLCGMAVFFCFYHSLYPDKTVGNLLYGTCMPGALFAILFPDWTAYPALSYHSILGFTVHTLLVCYPLMQVLAGDLRPDFRRLPQCLVLLLSLAVSVYVFDRVFEVNYMFLLQPAAGSPLEWFAHLLGTPGYLFGYFPMLALVWGILYAPFRNHKKKEAKIKK